MLFKCNPQITRSLHKMAISNLNKIVDLCVNSCNCIGATENGMLNVYTRTNSKQDSTYTNCNPNGTHQLFQLDDSLSPEKLISHRNKSLRR